MAQNFARDRDETESLVYFSLETETRPRLSPISAFKHSVNNIPFCRNLFKNFSSMSSKIVTTWSPTLVRYRRSKRLGFWDVKKSNPKAQPWS